MSFLKRRDPLANGQGSEFAYIRDPAEEQRYPALLEFLCCGQWPDGKPRQPGTLLFFLDEGRLKACLSDRDQGLVGFVTAPSLLGLIDTCEEGLETGEIDWRPQRKGGSRKS